MGYSKPSWDPIFPAEDMSQWEGMKEHTHTPMSWGIWREDDYALILELYMREKNQALPKDCRTGECIYPTIPVQLGW